MKAPCASAVTADPVWAERSESEKLDRFRAAVPAAHNFTAGAAAPARGRPRYPVLRQVADLPRAHADEFRHRSTLSSIQMLPRTVFIGSTAWRDETSISMV